MDLQYGVPCRSPDSSKRFTTLAMFFPFTHTFIHTTIWRTLWNADQPPDRQIVVSKEPFFSTHLPNSLSTHSAGASREYVLKDTLRVAVEKLESVSCLVSPPTVLKGYLAVKLNILTHFSTLTGKGRASTYHISCSINHKTGIQTDIFTSPGRQRRLERAKKLLTETGTKSPHIWSLRTIHL